MLEEFHVFGNGEYDSVNKVFNKSPSRMLRDCECFLAPISEMPWSTAHQRASKRVREGEGGRSKREREREQRYRPTVCSSEELLVCRVLVFGLQQLMELAKLDSF